MNVPQTSVDRLKQTIPEPASLKVPNSGPAGWSSVATILPANDVTSQTVVSLRLALPRKTQEVLQIQSRWYKFYGNNDHNYYSRGTVNKLEHFSQHWPQPQPQATSTLIGRFEECLSSDESSGQLFARFETAYN